MDLRNLQGAFETLESRYQELNELHHSRSKAYEQEINNLAQKLDEKETELKNTIIERDSRSTDNAVAHQHLESLKLQLDEKEKELHELIEERNTQINDKLLVLKTVEEIKHELEVTSASLIKVQSNLQDAVTENAANNQQIDLLTLNLNDKEKELQKIIGENDTQANEITAMQKMAESLKHELEVTSASLIKVQSNLQDAVTENAANNQQIDLLTLNLNDKEKELQKIIGENDTQANEITAMQKMAESLKHELEVTSASCIQLQSEMEVASIDNAMAHQNMESLKLQFDEKEKELNELIEERNTQINDKLLAFNTIEELKHQLEEASASLIQKRSEAENASEEAYLTMLQLQQAQEELQYYFSQSRNKQNLLEKCQDQQLRTKKIFIKFFSSLEK